jgi:RNA polymerase sigma-70 factor (ECF subfamily)
VPDDSSRDDAAGDDALDRALLQAHVAGDRDAFGRLVARHRDRLYAVALRTLGPAEREEAADALQDALLSAYRGAAGFRGDAKVSTWLHRVVVNACLDRLRRRAARPTVPMPEQEPAGTTDALGDRETALDVAAALAALPPDQRVALVLVDLQGLPVDEAARVLGIPVGTVKSRCSRGRARLAVSLGHLRNPRPAAPVLPPAPAPSRGAAGGPAPAGGGPA